MRVSVIGMGMLGSEVAALLESAGNTVKTFNFPDFDIRKRADIDAACKDAELVVNCAAYTAVDKAEAEPELCRQINALPLAELGTAALKAKAFVVHISTDFVFDGSGETPWRETDTPHPLNVYGATKLEGEQLLLASECPCAIMRVQWTYGRNGVNFVTKMLDLARTRNSLKVVDDQIGAPTNAADMAKEIKALGENRLQGVFHFAARGYCSRYESAKLIFKTAGLNVEVLPCKSTEFPTPALRPLNSRFDCAKIEAATGLERPAWDAALVSFIRSR